MRQANQPPASQPVARTVHAATRTPELTHRQLLARVARLCAQRSATTRPLLRQLDAPGIAPNFRALVDEVDAANRTLEFGLTGLHPSIRDSERFRRYRRDVMRNDTVADQINALLRTRSGVQPSQKVMDAGLDSALLGQADAVLLGVPGCNSWRDSGIVMRKLTGR